jgi:threonine/homoserine/homoserine lactone efflux protein
MLDVPNLVTYLTVMSVTPGPNNVMVTASGATFGYRATVPHILGIGAGVAAQTVLVCLGLGNLFERMPGLHTAMAWAGALYLLYMAWRLVGAGAVDAKSAARPLRWWEAAGFQAVNPKAWVMAMTTAAVFFPSQGPVVGAAFEVGGLFVLVSFPCVTLWALCGNALRRFLDRPVYRRAFNISMSVLLVGTAVMGLRG